MSAASYTGPSIGLAAPAPKGERSIARRAVWLALAYVVVTAGLLAALLIQLRSEAVVAAKRELSAFAQLTAGHTFEVALGIEEALKLTEITLSVTAGTGAADEDSIRAMLRDVATNSRALKDILVLDARGRVVYQANGKEDMGLDRSDRPYFVQFQRNPALKFDLGIPVRRRAQSGQEEWFIPATHAWRRSDGTFSGVIVGLMDPKIFDKAWTFDTEIEGLGIALTDADGMLIMRRPFAAELMGRSLVDSETKSQLNLRRDADTMQVRSPLDGNLQLLAYRKVAAYPNLLTFVAQPMDVVLAGWHRIVWIVSSVWCLASLGLGGLGLWLARERKVRGALEGRYHALFDSIPYPVIVSDQETLSILAFNSAAAQHYGWPTVGAYLPEDFAVLAAKRQEFSRTAATVFRDQRHRNKDGNPIDVEMAVRLIDYDGRRAALTVAVDVSDRLQAERARQAAEDQLRQSQKMDVLGQLTGGIAHDFNNILMVIIDNVEALTEKENVDPETSRHLTRIGDSAQRAEELTRQMLAFSRKQPLRPRPTNVNDLVVETGKLLRRTLGEQIEIDSVLSDELWTVEIDRAQFESALVQVCVNARDAMPTGGRLLVETQNLTLGADDPLPTAGLVPGAYVMIVVSDTGGGIPAQDLDKVFEPFFTTKDGGKGSGLGLSMVYGFIKQSNGHVAVASEIGQGTSFKLYLPRYDGAPDEAAVRKSPQAVGGTERVLVVEDDAQVRTSVVRQLQSLGYDVSQAVDGSAGVASFESASSPYDLLLTDVVMPGPLNGKALADEVARRWPSTRIVFMSGYTDNALVNRGHIDPDVRLLNKPFRKIDLAQMIRRALDSVACIAALMAFVSWLGLSDAVASTITAETQAVAASSSAPGAARTYVHKLRLTGIMETGDADKLRTVLAKMSSQTGERPGPLATIELSSLGGSLTEGFEMGALFRRHRVIAMVRKQDACLSSCALAFLGGNVHRTPSLYPADCNLEIGGKVAFHNFALNRFGLKESTTSDPVASRLQGFADARGGAALLVRYAGDMGLPPNFVATIMGRPVDEFLYIETVGQFLSFRVCPIGLTRPPASLAVQAGNVCNHSTGWQDATAALRGTEIPVAQAKRHLLERVQANMQSSKAKGRLAAQLSSGAVMRVKEEIDRLYEDLRAAGVSLPDIVGPTFEIGRTRDGAYEVLCYVSLSADEPDTFDVVIQGPKGFAEPPKTPPENARRLFLYDRDTVVNPKP